MPATSNRKKLIWTGITGAILAAAATFGIMKYSCDSKAPENPRVLVPEGLKTGVFDLVRFNPQTNAYEPVDVDGNGYTESGLVKGNEFVDILWGVPGVRPETDSQYQPGNSPRTASYGYTRIAGYNNSQGSLELMPIAQPLQSPTNPLQDLIPNNLGLSERCNVGPVETSVFRLDTQGVLAYYESLGIKPTFNYSAVRDTIINSPHSKGSIGYMKRRRTSD
ncbi:MAG: hypothetical protein PHF67_00640 [Candidatus Nanoarchaeia archaeon]|nr:hypothetical protein [Candidatus Nanoarchaeia archaeon]